MSWPRNRSRRGCRRTSPLELGDELGVLAQRKFGIDPVLDRDQPPLLEPLDLDLRERLVRDVVERPTSPECEGFAQLLGRVLHRPCVRGAPRFFDEPVEFEEVELPRANVELVTRRVRREILLAIRVEHLPQAVDLRLEAMNRIGRRSCTPEGLDEEVARDNLVGVHQKDGEQCSLLRTDERAAVVLDLEWPQNPIAHVTTAARQPTEANTVPRGREARRQPA
jgi:hypothetical protein